MALPPALLARLQKRGIVKSADEEVFAESYDAIEEKKREESLSGAPGCPNKNNVHHVCADYCYDHWREGIPESRLTEAYLRKKRRMLAKYPLPEPWIEVYDAGMARHYYWNQDTDDVCWVSPRHPSAAISEPAPRIARELAAKHKRDDRDRDSYNSRGFRDDRESRDRFEPRDRRRDRDDFRARKRRRSDDGSDNSDQEESDHEQRIEDMPERDRLRRAKRKGIDPMDPAAYGEAPVGNWAAGLRAHDKTGADVTANGPLFQQRPYPAPGAIMRSHGKPPPRSDDEDDM